MLYPYCAFPLWYLEHSRDITLLSDLIPWTTPTCFSTLKIAFFSCTCSYSSANVIGFLCTHLQHSLLFLGVDYGRGLFVPPGHPFGMSHTCGIFPKHGTGEPMHTLSKERMAPEVMLLTERAPNINY